MDTTVMACRCNGPAPRATNDYVAPRKTTSRAPASREAPAPVGPKKFCNKCGWVIKHVKYVDRKTKQIVEAMTCTNKQCPEYRM